ncbi:hypothetical protein HDU87_007463 [Geranomyces variabilis]|uniref:Uncharacterized protein n=1 Tax=Geranomyces variabilis TaxID=109894 RepID=A0AAD5TPI1_9FUNG|nr:hypothetical protein HDU87_007463 [Geranomyces variabilis]
MTRTRFYGLRHLAEVWAQTYVADPAWAWRTANSKTVLASISHLLLLDLLGAKYANKPDGTGTQVIQIKDKQATTQAQREDLVAAQNLLASQGLLSASVTAQMKGAADGGHLLQALDSVNGVQDDHIPACHSSSVDISTVCCTLYGAPYQLKQHYVAAPPGLLPQGGFCILHISGVRE